MRLVNLEHNFNDSLLIAVAYVSVQSRSELGIINVIERLRPYHAECTGSRPITEVKQRRARSVLGWVTAWEHPVL